MRFTRKPFESMAVALVVLGGLYFLLTSSAQLTDPQPLSPHATSTTSPVASMPVTTTATTPETVQDITHEEKQQEVLDTDVVSEEIITSGSSTGIVDAPFMPSMNNETLKAELGNAAWKLFHTILARYPDVPTLAERETLEQYIYLFAKVYPCGDCAQHFTELLKQFPPQTGSRQIAAVWGCHVHNQVNERLGHPAYDCSHIIEDYDCGCGDDEVKDAQDNTKVEVEQDHLKFDLEKEEKQLG